MPTTNKTIFYFLENEFGRRKSIGFVDEDNTTIESGNTFTLEVKVTPEKLEDFFGIVDVPNSVILQLAKRLASEFMLASGMKLEEHDLIKLNVFTKDSKNLKDSFATLTRRQHETHFSPPSGTSY